LYVINPAYGLREALEAALPALAARLDAGGSGWRVALD
jgi:23S rRNA A2030 N6-methylase RlmJ